MGRPLALIRAVVCGFSHMERHTHLYVRAHSWQRFLHNGGITLAVERKRKVATLKRRISKSVNYDSHVLCVCT